MIITKREPYTKAEIEKLQELFETYIKTEVIDGNSFINIRPSDKNTSNEIQDPAFRSILENLMKYFFKEVL